MIAAALKRRFAKSKATNSSPSSHDDSWAEKENKMLKLRQQQKQAEQVGSFKRCEGFGLSVQRTEPAARGKGNGLMLCVQDTPAFGRHLLKRRVALNQVNNPAQH
jgi:hypothetical protein